MDGLSENANKECLSKKLMAKLTKMSSVNSRIERKTVGN